MIDARLPLASETLLAMGDRMLCRAPSTCRYTAPRAHAAARIVTTSSFKRCRFYVQLVGETQSQRHWRSWKTDHYSRYVLRLDWKCSGARVCGHEGSLRELPRGGLPAIWSASGYRSPDRSQIPILRKILPNRVLSMKIDVEISLNHAESRVRTLWQPY